jgi:3-deoxy-D-manno-octulosonic-acid transferase
MLKKSYRLFQTRFVEPILLPIYFSKNRRSFAKKLPQAPCPPRIEGKNRTWFHAASVGELESLWPLILSVADQGHELILTILSESAFSTLAKLTQSLGQSGKPVLYSGYSPWEGHWVKYLQRWKPTLFVTAKYEAWPDLWVSLREEEIPLAIVSARARKSLRVAKKLCTWFSGGLPDLLLFTCNESDLLELRQLFPGALIQSVGEPRWDRVYSRAQVGNSRAKELIQVYRDLKRPWGVIGSAWIEDLRFLKPVFQNSPGTVWVVPHRIDDSHVKEMEGFLKDQGLSPIKTRDIRATSPNQGENRKESLCVLVNEMGFLSELYSVADWAFVGGGFGAGIHSTIEPAIYGIPIAAGPNGTEKFTEVADLSSTGQLRILSCEGDVLSWMNQLNPDLFAKKQKWAGEAQSRLGATQKIVRAIENFE